MAADALKNMDVIDVTDDYKYLVAGPLGTEGTMGKQMEPLKEYMKSVSGDLKIEIIPFY